MGQSLSFLDKENEKKNLFMTNWFHHSRIEVEEEVPTCYQSLACLGRKRHAKKNLDCFKTVIWTSNHIVKLLSC
jgi:hypothetical protein